MRTYKIRKYQQGKNKEGTPYLHYSLTIPTEVAEKLPEGMQFQIELTDEGILYRPVGTARDVGDLLPAWAKQANENMSPDGDEPEPEEKPKPKNNTRQRPARKPVRK